MLSLAAAATALTVLFLDDAGRGSSADRTLVVPLFSWFPAREIYTGPAAAPRFKSAEERDILQVPLAGTPLAPNFAGRFRIFQFRTGSGQLGAILLDSKTGTVFRLPHEIVNDDFFIHGTECLPAYRGLSWAKAGDEGDPSEALSFKTDSELLIVRRCRAEGTSVTPVDKRYYRWHGRKWHLIKRLVSPPVPVY